MVSQTSVNDETKRRAFKSASVGEKKKRSYSTPRRPERRKTFERAFDVDILRLLFFLLYTRAPDFFVYTQHRRMTLDDNLHTIITYECGHILLIFRSKKTPSFLKRFLQRDDDVHPNHQQKAPSKSSSSKSTFVGNAMVAW